MELRAGDFLQNRYEIIQKIGTGGMADVYKAQCHILHRPVAIKILKEEFCHDSEIVLRFRKEAQSAAGLVGHPNIVSVYDVVDDGNYHYIVMELIEGCTVKNRILKEGRLSIQESIGIAIQVADGLEYAHERHIIHRDIKPQNMIISKDTGKVKIADFGIASVVTEHTISLENQAIGSAHYISPEQAKGATVDERSDIYSLGITIYEMVTGRLPFEGDTTVAVLLAQVEENITPPSTYRNDIPRSLEKIILKCTNKDPNLRYQSMKTLARDLNSAYVHPEAEPPSFVRESQGSTRPISKEDLMIINTAKERQAKNQAQTAKRSKPVNEAHDIDDDEKKFDKLFSAIGIVVALVIAIIAFLVVSKTLGVFKSENKASESETVLDETELDETQVKVPDIVDMNEELAEGLLKENNLQIQISGSEHSDTISEGNIISQEPKADEITSKYSKVNVIVSLGSDKTDIASLNIADMDIKTATSILEAQGFVVDSTKHEFSDTVEKDHIISFSPEKAAKGETITIVVSDGAETTMVVVPDIKGQTEEIAIGMLTDVGLVPGKASTEHSDTVEKGNIISQATDPESTVAAGTAIDYVVSAGVEETTSAHKKTYVASIDTSYNISDLIGPGSSNTKITIMVRLKQVVNGSTKYTTLMEPRSITGDTILPIRYKNIEGAYGVDQGEVEVVQNDTQTVLKSYTVEFFPMD